LDLQIKAMKQCALEAGQAEGMEKPAVLLMDTVNQLETLRKSTSWDEILEHSEIDY
jgi:hypothetical protein